MRTNAIQSETFGTTSSALKAARKGYSVLIGGQKFIVGQAKENAPALGSLSQAKDALCLKVPDCRINYLA